jgi:hypothetical protein
MKVVTLTALFPELKGGACYQRGRGTGTSIRTATARAFADMYKRMKVRKTFTECSVQMTFGNVAEESIDTGFTATVTVAKIKEQAEVKESA